MPHAVVLNKARWQFWRFEAVAGVAFGTGHSRRAAGAGSLCLTPRPVRVGLANPPTISARRTDQRHRLSHFELSLENLQCFELTNVRVDQLRIGQSYTMHAEAAPQEKVAGESPRCADCGIPAMLRMSVMDQRANHYVRVYQCQNCAKLIWSDSPSSARSVYSN